MTESSSMTDDPKNMELESQQTPAQEKQDDINQYANKKKSLVEATAVQVLDAVPQQQQQQQQAGGVVVHHYIVSSPASPVRNNSAVQCCYPASALAFCVVTTDDPVEVVRARDVAISQICAELAGTVFCSSEWCLATPFVAVLSASLVACCSKLGITYMLWSGIGALLCVIHAVTAGEAIIQEASNYWWSPIVLFFAQMFLCAVSLAVVYSGWKTAAATRRPVCPVENQLLQMPMQAPMHPVVAETPQQHSQASRMSP